MPLHDAVGINCKNGELQKLKEQVSSIFAKGDCSIYSIYIYEVYALRVICWVIVCVIRLGMTNPPWSRKKVMVYYYYYYYYYKFTGCSNNHVKSQRSKESCQVALRIIML